MEEKKPNAINWFEIPAADFNRAVKFYGEILQADLSVNKMGDYDMGFFPGAGVTGAVVAGEGYKPSADGTMVYLNCGNDLTDVLNRIEPAGGKVIMPKTEITPEYGHFAMFIDSEGNKMALHSQN
jgi:predicted enzyme related to lactoylglutathione lyase